MVIPLLQHLLTQISVTYSEIERMVGKLVSLECAVPAGMWYTRHQYAAMTFSGLNLTLPKELKIQQ